MKKTGIKLSGAAGPALYVALLTVVLSALFSMHSKAGIFTKGPVSGLISHKALYDIGMVSKKSGSQILNISGDMYFEWRQECEAWSTDNRFNLYYDYVDSPRVKVSSDFSTYETFDGRSLDFTSRRTSNGDLDEELRGRAEKDGTEQGRAVYTIPDGLSFDLKKGYLFPMAHTLELMKRIGKGEKFFSAVVFDGSDRDGPVEINTFIGSRVTADESGEASPTLDAALLQSPAWKVRMAFFPLQEPESDAEYEIDFIIHENGVISAMTIEYRDFSIAQTLKALEPVPPAECSGSGNKFRKGP